MLARQLKIYLDELKGNKTPWYEHTLSFVEELWHSGLVKCRWYDVRYFIRNLPHFLKQAWVWRGFDHAYTIESFCENLELLAKGLASHGNCTLSERNYKRCLTAAAQLRKAYADDFIFTDKSYINWAKNNNIYFEKLDEENPASLYIMKTARKYPLEYSQKMQHIIQKRQKKQDATRKKEAWAYIHKHIEMWWD